MKRKFKKKIIPKAPKIGFFQRFIIQCISTLFSLMITVAIALGLVYIILELQLPDVSTLKDYHLQVPLRVFSKEGKLIAEYGDKKRIPITLDKVPKQMIDAVLATEDARFYSHPGIDFIGLARATIAVITTGRKVQGASTITMQVARNFFLNPEKTYTRKIREILLALKIDREFSKDKILELYLNKVYFGRHAYGVAAAAKVYYGKDLHALTLPEMAMIAGLPQAPSRDNPLSNPESALKRRNHVLDRMLEVGFIDQPTHNRAIQAPNTATYHILPVEINAPYVGEMVRQAMVSQFGNEAYEEGLNVYTTVAANLQETANQAVKNGLIAYANRHGGYQRNFVNKSVPRVEGALVSLNPQTGAIYALVGGYDYRLSNFNRVTQAERQPGSNFKPFIYTAALDKGFTLASVVNDSPIVIRQESGELWRPYNDEMKFFGPTRLRVGLAKSRNLVSIRVLQSIGPKYAANFVNRFGFDSQKMPKSLSLALGSGVVTPLQMAAGYSVFANGGYYVTPYFINQIRNQKGEVVYQAKPQMACAVCGQDPDMASQLQVSLAPQAISPEDSYLITSALHDVIRYGTATHARELGRNDLAGKTGTTNEQVDAWFSGYNPDVETTVWVGFDNSQSLREYGAQAALPIWMDYMKVALADKPEHYLPIPPGIVSAKIDPYSGNLARQNQDNAILEVFKKESVPNVIAANDDSGGVAGGGAGPSDQNEPLF